MDHIESQELMEKIEMLSKKYKQLHENYLTNFELKVNYIKHLKSYSYSREKLEKYKTLNTIRKMKYTLKEHWLVETANHFKESIKSLENDLEYELMLIERLKNICKQIDIPLFSPSSSREDNACDICKSSVLECPHHPNDAFAPHFINEKLLEKIKDKPNTIIAIDTENVTVRKCGKFINEAIRVALVTRINRRRPIELLYHSFWFPSSRNIRVFTDIVGLTREDIIYNRRSFREREPERVMLMNIVRNKNLVFANAVSDIKAIGFDVFPKYFDIQTFFRRYTDENYNNQPISLKVVIGEHTPNQFSRKYS